MKSNIIALIILLAPIYATYKTAAIAMVFRRHAFTNTSTLFLTIKYIVVFLLVLNIIAGLAFYLVIAGYIYLGLTEGIQGESGIVLGFFLFGWLALFIPLRLLYIPVHIEYTGV